VDEAETAVETDWRDDPGWRLVQCAPEGFDAPPAKPTAGAELAQPALWASAYDETGRRIIACWFRPTVIV
jgi:hypothetical protein